MKARKMTNRASTPLISIMLLALIAVFEAAGCQNGKERLMQPAMAAPPPKEPTAFDKCLTDFLPLECEQLASDYFEGNSGAKDHGRALRLYRAGCATESPWSCFGEARVLLETEGIHRDYKRGMRLMRQVCESGIACDHYGAWLEKEGADGLKRALQIWERACLTGKQPASCLVLGYRFSKGKDGVAKDTAYAARMLEKACPFGKEDLIIGCDMLADLYLRGDGVPRDAVKAADMLERSCRAIVPMSCLSLARLYKNGVGVARNAARARQLVAKACYREKDPEACREL